MESRPSGEPETLKDGRTDLMKGCRPLTDAEVIVVLKSFGGRYAWRDRALFLLGVKSGFRVSELLSLRWGDVWQHGQPVDRVTVPRRHMKQRLEGRTVLLHPEAKAALAGWLHACAGAGALPADTYVFRSRKGGNRPISRRHALRVVKDAYEANGLTGHVATHSMRKTFANKVYQHLTRRRAAGEAIDPFRLTSKALGHRNIASTDHYLSFLEAEIDHAILAS
jgi:integrase